MPKKNSIGCESESRTLFVVHKSGSAVTAVNPSSAVESLVEPSSGVRISGFYWDEASDIDISVWNGLPSGDVAPWSKTVTRETSGLRGTLASDRWMNSQSFETEPGDTTR